MFDLGLFGPISPPASWMKLSLGMSRSKTHQRKKERQKEQRHRNKDGRKGQGSQENGENGEMGAKESEGLFNAACSFNYTCYSLFCVGFFYIWVFYVLVCPLHGPHPQGQRSRQRFCYFFLLLTSYILWTLFSESYWSSSPQRRTTAEKNGVSVVLHRSVRPGQSHGTMRGSGKPEDVFKWEPWSTLSVCGGASRAANLEGGPWADKHDRWRIYPGRILSISIFFSQMDQNWSIDLS